MEKKGQFGGYVVVIVGLVLAILLLVNLAFPQWRTTTSAQTTTQPLTEHLVNVSNTTTTLTNTDLVSGGLTIAGLTVTTHYVVDYDSATVTVLNATASGNYTATYQYYAAGYIENAGTRAFAGVVILFIIAGLVAGAFKMFGML